MKPLKEILLWAALGFILWLALRPHPVETRQVIRTDTLTVVRTDTLRIREPVYITRRIVDTIRLVIRQTDTVYLPRAQRRYEDSLYTAWVSGYQARLDSIRIYFPTKIRYITKEIKTAQKPPRWGLSLQAGYGISKNGLAPYAGIGVSYNILTW